MVIRAGAASGYGQAVYILGVSGDVTIYGHMEEIEVSAGATPSRPGRPSRCWAAPAASTGPHLHFEVCTAGG